ncbi:hypothetical protein [Cystobacter fuscus]|uniref:hypothetical protein n=1 Tax=Cystobacter fuscus TaxID=43 RepID=UPI0037BF0729
MPLKGAAGAVSQAGGLHQRLVVTAPQRRRGVGTVVVTRPDELPGTATQVLLRLPWGQQSPAW